MTYPRSRLEKLGVVVPERPLSTAFACHTLLGALDYAEALSMHVNDLESAAEKLAGKLEEALKCDECNGTGYEDEDTALEQGVGESCPRCHGTGARSAG